jgi:hypothetical protein
MIFRQIGLPNDTYRSLSACRLEIMRTHHNIDYSLQLPELALEFVEEEIDSRIEMQLNSFEGKKKQFWAPFNDNFREIKPFTGLIEGGLGKVYVIQCKKLKSHGWKHVYVGFTEKEIGERYDEHINPKEHNYKPTKASRNFFTEDETVGLRWDLMNKYFFENESLGFMNENAGRSAEGNLFRELKKSGFIVHGDAGFGNRTKQK